MVSEAIDGYLLTVPRDTIALIGERVELDCTTNSSRTVDWHVIRYGDSKDMWISRGNQKRPNISDAFRILRKEVGQFALVIDPALMSLAGRYQCSDKDEEESFAAEVIVLSEKISPSISYDIKLGQNHNRCRRNIIIIVVVTVLSVTFMHLGHNYVYLLYHDYN